MEDWKERDFEPDPAVSQEALGCLGYWGVLWS